MAAICLKGVLNRAEMEIEARRGAHALALLLPRLSDSSKVNILHLEGTLPYIWLTIPILPSVILSIASPNSLRSPESREGNADPATFLSQKRT